MNKKLIGATVLVPSLVSTQRDEALNEVLGAFVESRALAEKTRSNVLDQLLARERQGSTGLGNGVAVPHVKEADVSSITVGVGITREGIGFDAIDGRPVHIMFVVLGPAGGPPEEHLGVLRWVSTLARNADFRRFAINITTTEDLQDLLLEMTESS